MLLRRHAQVARRAGRRAGCGRRRGRRCSATTVIGELRLLPEVAPFGLEVLCARRPGRRSSASGSGASRAAGRSRPSPADPPACSAGSCRRIAGASIGLMSRTAVMNWQAEAQAGTMRRRAPRQRPESWPGARSASARARWARRPGPPPARKRRSLRRRPRRAPRRPSRSHRRRRRRRGSQRRPRPPGSAPRSPSISGRSGSAARCRACRSARSGRGRLTEVLRKWVDLELRHRPRTIPSHRCRKRSPEPSSSSTTRPRATATSSSSTATTSPTARSSRCPRSSRRPTASRRTRCSASRTCSSSCSPTTGRRASPSPGTRARSQRAATAEAADVVYKEGRKPMPDLLREQFPHFRPIVEAFGYRNLEFEGWEADDVIATLATRADAAGDQDVRRLDRPRRVPALLRERLPDDDAARRRRRQRLHARARRGALRRHGPSRCPTSSA